jgi:hypothetical protein
MARRKAIAFDPNNFNRNKGKRRGKVSVDLDATNLTGSVVFYGAPTPPDNGYVIVSDSNTRYGISSATATPVFWTATDADIVSVVDSLPGNTSNITTQEQAFQYLAGNNYYVISPNSKTTPTDSLIFEVDARRVASYPQTGNIWYDLSPESNHMNYTYNNSNIEYEDATKSMFRTVRQTQADHYRSTNTYDLDGDFTMIVLAKVYQCHNRTANGLLTNHSHAHNTGAGITVRTITNDLDFRISCNTGTGSSRTFHTYYGTSNIKDKWSHLMVHYSGNTLSLWVNGVKEYTRSYSMASRADYIDLFNWSTTYNSSSNYRPKCKIQYGQVFEKALTNTEISQSYYQGDIVTDGLIRALDFSNLVCYESGSSNGRDLTLNDTYDLFNTPTYTTDYGGGIACNNTNEFIALAATTPTNYVSAECWFRRDNNDGGENIIFNKENCWEVKEEGGGLYWALYANNQSWFWDYSNANIAVGEICQIVLTYDGDTVKFYKNGIQTDTHNYPNGGILANQTAAYPKLNSRGASRTSTSSLGNMSYFQFRVYDKALSDGEVLKNFNANRDIFSL